MSLEYVQPCIKNTWQVIHSKTDFIVYFGKPSIPELNWFQLSIRTQFIAFKQFQMVVPLQQMSFTIINIFFYQHPARSIYWTSKISTCVRIFHNFCYLYRRWCIFEEPQTFWPADVMDIHRTKFFVDLINKNIIWKCVSFGYSASYPEPAKKKTRRKRKRKKKRTSAV